MDLPIEQNTNLYECEIACKFIVKMPPKFKGPKLPKIPICTTPEPAPVVPVDLDKHTTITIDNETFDIEADDLEVICELGKFENMWGLPKFLKFISKDSFI